MIGVKSPVYPSFNNFARPWLPVDNKDIVLTEEALRIHRSAIVIDGHNDLLYMIRVKWPSALETLDMMHISRNFKRIYHVLPLRDNSLPNYQDKWRGGLHRVTLTTSTAGRYVQNK